MIIFLILNLFIYIFSLIFAPFPIISELPWGIDEFLISGVGGYRMLAEFFPPFNTVLSAFLIYIGYRISIIVLRFFLGSRTPTA